MKKPENNFERLTNNPNRLSIAEIRNSISSYILLCLLTAFTTSCDENTFEISDDVVDLVDMDDMDEFIDESGDMGVLDEIEEVEQPAKSFFDIEWYYGSLYGHDTLEYFTCSKNRLVGSMMTFIDSDAPPELRSINFGYVNEVPDIFDENSFELSFHDLDYENYYINCDYNEFPEDISCTLENPVQIDDRSVFYLYADIYGQDQESGIIYVTDLGVYDSTTDEKLEHDPSLGENHTFENDGSDGISRSALIPALRMDDALEVTPAAPVKLTRGRVTIAENTDSYLNILGIDYFDDINLMKLCVTVDEPVTLEEYNLTVSLHNITHGEEITVRSIIDGVMVEESTALIEEIPLNDPLAGHAEIQFSLPQDLEGPDMTHTIEFNIDVPESRINEHNSGVSANITGLECDGEFCDQWVFIDETGTEISDYAHDYSIDGPNFVIEY